MNRFSRTIRKSSARNIASAHREKLIIWITYSSAIIAMPSRNSAAVSFPVSLAKLLPRNELYSPMQP